MQNTTPGEYPGRILETATAALGKNETPAVVITVELSDGSQVRPAIWMTERAAGMARQALKACGFDVDLRDLSDLDREPSPLVGNRVRVRVKEDDYKPGTTKAEIVFGGSKPDAAKLGDAMKLLRGAKSADEAPVAETEKVPPRGAVKPPAAAPGVDFDDIPF